jgi:hypothetical protein
LREGESLDSIKAFNWEGENRVAAAFPPCIGETSISSSSTVSTSSVFLLLEPTISIPFIPLIAEPSSKSVLLPVLPLPALPTLPKCSLDTLRTLEPSSRPTVASKESAAPSINISFPPPPCPVPRLESSAKLLCVNAARIPPLRPSITSGRDSVSLARRRSSSSPSPSSSSVDDRPERGRGRLGVEVAKWAAEKEGSSEAELVEDEGGGCCLSRAAGEMGPRYAVEDCADDMARDEVGGGRYHSVGHGEEEAWGRRKGGRSTFQRRPSHRILKRRYKGSRRDPECASCMRE